MTTKKPTRRPRHAYNRRLVDLICERIAVDGIALREICQDTACRRDQLCSFGCDGIQSLHESIRFAKLFQIQCLSDDLIDIADGCSKDWIEREGPDGKKFRVFDHENFRRSKRQMGALQWRISKLMPKRYYWMRWGPRRMRCTGRRGYRRVAW